MGHCQRRKGIPELCGMLWTQAEGSEETYKVGKIVPIQQIRKTMEAK